ncbi:LysR family transcriptional regulator ['Osedax' symbiont bacterium Rs2_46_30_T18]|nr:LysR family transcriptional regulator ['Osedax' symbiont bacterium Rs2_46_30_T18]
MRIRNLSSFVKVARLGSFRAASAQLHISQPALSARINTLEDELGVSLFRRGKSGTDLTEKGSELLPYAEKLLAIAQEMQLQAGQRQQQKGVLKIGIADTLAHLWLTPLLQLWQQQHPQISFELTSDVSPVLIKQLQQHQIDLTLMVAEPTNTHTVVSQSLCSYQQVWVIKAAKGLKTDCWSISEMAKRPILSFPRDTSPWHYLQQLFKSEASAAVIHTCSSVASLISLAEQGLGIALLPLPLVEKQLASGSLVRINTEIEPLMLEFCCCWRADEESALPKLLADSATEIMASSD